MYRPKLGQLCVGALLVSIVMGAVWFPQLPAGAQSGDYLTIPTRFETGLFGIANGQTARLSVANNAMPEGMLVVFEIINSEGETVVESLPTRVGLNHSATYDFVNPPGNAGRVRAEVRARVEVQGLTNPRYAPGFIPTLEVLAPTSNTLFRIDSFQPSP